MRFLSVTPRSVNGCEHRRDRALRVVRHVDARALRDPVLEFRQIRGVAFAQVLVRDALRARQQRIRELLRLERGIALHVLEPLRRIARRILDAQHIDAAHIAVMLQRAFEIVGMRRDAVRQFDRVFERQLGARADREVRRVRRVAHQHDGCRPAVGARAVVDPVLVHHARKADPLRGAAQMLGVRLELVAVEIAGEQPFAERDAVLLAHLVEPCRAPDALGPSLR